jgi:hypothetical protein
VQGYVQQTQPREDKLAKSRREKRHRMRRSIHRKADVSHNIHSKHIVSYRVR